MEGGFFNTTQMRILGALTLLMVIIALGSYASLNFEQAEFVNPAPASISVTGKGEVLKVPDIGQFSFSVNAEGETATIVQEQSGTKVNEIIAYLKEQGVAEKDIKTQDYYLNPKYRYEERVCESRFGYCPPGERVEDGFELRQTVLVKLRDIDSAGVIIVGVGERGATNISGLDFTIDDIEALKAEARELAIKDAQEKAAILAKNLNVRVVRLVGYYEDSNDYMPYAETRVMSMADTEESFKAPELPVGERSATVQVNVTYQVE